MVLTTAPVKVKITKDDGTSELRRLGFTFDNSLVSSGPFGQQIQVEGYHLGLIKFLLRSLRELYPEQPFEGFSDGVVFTVKDEDGDMVRFDSEEEFVAAMPGFQSWKSCLRVEVTVLKAKATTPVPAPAPTPTPTHEAEADPPVAENPQGVEAEATAAPAVPSTVGPPVSESGSMISFDSGESMLRSASSASSGSSSASAPTAASTRDNSVTCASLAPTPEIPVDLPTTAAAASPAKAVAAEAAPPLASPMAGLSSPPLQPGDEGYGDPTTPARTFLTQVLPGLADVLARSMYAAQWVPEIMPNTVSSASTAARIGENPVAPVAAGLAAAAATAAATMAHSAAEAVQASAESTAAAVGAPAFPPAQQESQPPPVVAPTAAPPAVSAAVNANAVPAVSPAPSAVVHKGIACDGCDMLPIVGTRYKCAVRNDFDLCEACEAESGADAPFPFLKIRTPAHTPAAIVCLLKPDQPATAEETSSAGKNSRGGNGGSGQSSRSYGPGQAWRGARKAPQHGGWGEGRRNCPRWMRDLARRQQQQYASTAASTAEGGAGAGGVPADVDFVRGGRPAWCGPRMQRRREDMSPSVPSSGAGEDTAKKAPVVTTSADGEVIGESITTTPPCSPLPTDGDAGAEKSAAPTGNSDAAVKEGGEVAPISVETGAPVHALTDAAVAESTSQGSAEYHDLLAASMRSLASSMTASYPSGSSAQDSKPRTGTAGGDACKPQGKPMARFVTDVSVADGSPLPPNTRFVKTWCMRNDGAVIFPVGCKLMPVSGDLMAGPEEGVPVEQRAPGEEFHVSVALTTPPLSGRYIGYWRLHTAEGQKFGHRIWADVLVTGGTADLVVEGSMDGDWDLVNMQRLSKAVEVTAKDAQNVVADADAAAMAMAMAASTTEAGNNASVETPAWVAEDAAPAPVPALAPAHVDFVDSGIEETKSADEGGQGQEVIAAGTEAEEKVPSAAVTKWHRELCSLAEMGFENTSRNIDLLEKHVISSGSPGMERVLHELLSWHEVSL